MIDLRLPDCPDFRRKFNFFNFNRIQYNAFGFFDFGDYVSVDFLSADLDTVTSNINNISYIENSVFRYKSLRYTFVIERTVNFFLIKNDKKNHLEGESIFLFALN